MTSANISETPIISDNGRGAQGAGRHSGRLSAARPRHTDEVRRLARPHIRRRDYPLRRSRGYVPYPISVPAEHMLLACGAEQKALLLPEQERARLPEPAYGGDLRTPRRWRTGRSRSATSPALRHRARGLWPAICTPTTSRRPTRRRGRSARGCRFLRVQHHHAHMAACMADNGLDGRLPRPHLGRHGASGSTGQSGAARYSPADTAALSAWARYALSPRRGRRGIDGIWRAGLALLRDSGADTELFSGEERVRNRAQDARNRNKLPAKLRHGTPFRRRGGHTRHKAPREL